MPGVSSLLDAINPEDLIEHPESVNLWLPSNLLKTSRDKICLPGLLHTEYRIRFVQATEALNDVRFAQQIYRGLIVKNKAHISSSQKTKTRSDGLFGRFKAKVTKAATTYRAAHAAIKRLAPDEEFGAWKNALRRLRNRDIRGPGSEGSESRHVPSWIWFTSPGQQSVDADLEVPATPEQLHSSVRVEWCRLQERLARFKEEVQLTVEEMRRVLVFFEWKARKWETSAASRNHQDLIDERTKAGINAYAHRQADVYRRMITVFIQDWFTLLESNELASSWLPNYPAPFQQVDRRRLVSNVNLYHPNAPPAEIDLVVVDTIPDVGDVDPTGDVSADSDGNSDDTDPVRDVDADSNDDSGTF